MATVRIIKFKNAIRLEIPYNEEFLVKFKALRIPRTWNPINKRWTIQPENLEQVKVLLSQYFENIETTLA